MKVSPGCISAMNAAWLAVEPECGCTLAKLALEQLLGALDGQRLGLVDVLAAAVVAVARIALGVLVGEHGAGRLQHRARDHVLRGDQLDLVLLAFQLATDDAGELGVALGQRGGEEARLRRLAAPGGLRWPWHSLC